MKRFKTTCVALVAMASALTINGAAVAKDKSGAFAVDGAGQRTCQEFTAARKSGSADLQLYAGWVDGYFSAINQFHPDTYDVTPWQTTELLVAQLDKFCTARPAEKFLSAVNALAFLLQQQKLSKSSEIMSVRNAGQGVYIYKDVLLRVKKRLREEGFEPGKTNDAFTKSTSNALIQYQGKMRLTLSGLPDQATLNALFAGAIE